MTTTTGGSFAYLMKEETENHRTTIQTKSVVLRPTREVYVKMFCVCV